MLLETHLCEFRERGEGVQSKCEPGLEAMKAFRPATAQGQTLVNMMFKPEIECQALKTKEACLANKICRFDEDNNDDGGGGGGGVSGSRGDNECHGDDSAMMGTPPPSSCKESDKVPVTLLTQVSEGFAKCSSARDEAACKLVTTADCKFDNGRCDFDGDAMMGGLMMVRLTTHSLLLTNIKPLLAVIFVNRRFLYCTILPSQKRKV